MRCWRQRVVIVRNPLLVRVLEVVLNVVGHARSDLVHAGDSTDVAAQRAGSVGVRVVFPAGTAACRTGAHTTARARRDGHAATRVSST